jgi:hypothetical protein
MTQGASVRAELRCIQLTAGVGVDDCFRLVARVRTATALATERNSANRAALAAHPMDSKRTAAWRGKGRDGAGDLVRVGKWGARA